MKAGIGWRQRIPIAPRHTFLLSEIKPVPVSLRALARPDLAKVEPLETVRAAVERAHPRPRGAHQQRVPILVARALKPLGGRQSGDGVEIPLRHRLRALRLPPVVSLLIASGRVGVRGAIEQ